MDRRTAFHLKRARAHINTNPSRAHRHLAKCGFGADLHEYEKHGGNTGGT